MYPIQGYKESEPYYRRCGFTNAFTFLTNILSNIIAANLSTYSKGVALSVKWSQGRVRAQLFLDSFHSIVNQNTCNAKTTHSQPATYIPRYIHSRRINSQSDTVDNKDIASFRLHSNYYNFQCKDKLSICSTQKNIHKL